MSDPIYDYIEFDPADLKVVGAFAKAHPELGLMSDTPNKELMDAYFAFLDAWEFYRDLDAVIARYAEEKRERKIVQLERRSISPRRRAFRLKVSTGSTTGQQGVSGSAIQQISE